MFRLIAQQITVPLMSVDHICPPGCAAFVTLRHSLPSEQAKQLAGGGNVIQLPLLKKQKCIQRLADSFWRARGNTDSPLPARNVAPKRREALHSP